MLIYPQIGGIERVGRRQQVFRATGTGGRFGRFGRWLRESF
jgi:hypothetical protein